MWLCEKLWSDSCLLRQVKAPQTNFTSRLYRNSEHIYFVEFFLALASVSSLIFFIFACKSGFLVGPLLQKYFKINNLTSALVPPRYLSGVRDRLLCHGIEMDTELLSTTPIDWPWLLISTMWVRLILISLGYSPTYSEAPLRMLAFFEFG
jgi:hypothetical protein